LIKIVKNIPIEHRANLNPQKAIKIKQATKKLALKSVIEQKLPSKPNLHGIENRAIKSQIAKQEPNQPIKLAGPQTKHKNLRTKIENLIQIKVHSLN
jgi:hypothetical protein